VKSNFHGYALGFDIRDYRGHKLVTHTGGLPGYVSRVAMLPDAGAGVAVLTNQESGEAFDSIAFHVLDHYLNAPPFDWIDGYERLRGRNHAAAAAMGRAASASRDAAAKPSLPLPRYAGTYRDASYGPSEIAEQSGPVSIRF